MYTTINFKTKKELKEAVAAGTIVTVQILQMPRYLRMVLYILKALTILSLTDGMLRLN